MSKKRKLPLAAADAISSLEAHELTASQDIRYNLAAATGLRQYMRDLINEHGSAALLDMHLNSVGTLGWYTMLRTYLTRWPLARYEAPCPSSTLADAVVDIVGAEMPDEQDIPQHVRDAVLLCAKAELNRALQHLARTRPISKYELVEQTASRRRLTVAERANLYTYGMRSPLVQAKGPSTWQDVIKSLNSVPGMEPLADAVRSAITATVSRMEELYGPLEQRVEVRPESAHVSQVTNAYRAQQILDDALEDAARVDALLPQYSFGSEYDDSILHESYEDYIPVEDEAPNGLRAKDQLIIDAMMLSSSEEDESENDSESESEIESTSSSEDDSNDTTSPDSINTQQRPASC